MKKKEVVDSDSAVRIIIYVIFVLIRQILIKYFLTVHNLNFLLLLFKAFYCRKVILFANEIIFILQKKYLLDKKMLKVYKKVVGNEVAGILIYLRLFFCTSDGSPEVPERKRRNERLAKGGRSDWACNAQGAHIK